MGIPRTESQNASKSRRKVPSEAAVRDAGHRDFAFLGLGQEIYFSLINQSGIVTRLPLPGYCHLSMTASAVAGLFFPDFVTLGGLIGLFHKGQQFFLASQASLQLNQLQLLGV